MRLRSSVARSGARQKISIRVAGVLGMLVAGNLSVPAQASVAGTNLPDPPLAPPYVGVLIHTVYASSTSLQWRWYQDSSAFWETKKQPVMGFYNQLDGTSVEQTHYQELREAKADFALVSWYGDPSDSQGLGAHPGAGNARSDHVLASYWNVFTAANRASKEPPIRLAVLMEYAEKNYRQRIDYLKATYYDRNPDQVLKYEGKPVLALGFNGNKPALDNPAVAYARSQGFYVGDGNASGAGSFIGITMKAEDPHRLSPVFAGVGPGADVSGKTIPLEAEKLTIGAGRAVPDSAASGGMTVESTGTGDIVSTTLPASDMPKKARYNEARAIFRLKTKDVATIQGTVSVTDDAGNTYSLPITPGSFSGNNVYSHLILLFPRPGDGPIKIRVNLIAGDVSVDRLWLTTACFRKGSPAQFDAQWDVIEKMAPEKRPVFICVGALNCWEESTVIETNNVDGTLYLDRTAYWSQRLKREALSAGATATR